MRPDFCRPSDSLRRRVRVAAFTLVEVIVALAIFVLLAGGIYMTVDGALRGTATLSEEGLRSQRLDAFLALLRRTLHSLPSTATFEGRIRDEDGKSLPELQLGEAPGFFSWGLRGGSGAPVLLAARPQAGGGAVFSLLRLPEEATEMEMREVLRKGRWLPLLPDLRDVKWRFYDRTTMQWLEEWKDPASRPALVELSFTLLGESSPRTNVFWMPPVVPFTDAGGGQAADDGTNRPPGPGPTPPGPVPPPPAGGGPSISLPGR